MMNQEQPEFPRSFVPQHCELGDWEAIHPLFEDLIERELESPEQLETWLLHQSELAACLDEERARRYIAMTCNTHDPQCESRFLHFLENIEPKCKPLWHQINQKYHDSPLRSQLPQTRYEVLDRNIEAEIRIYHPDNVALQTKAAKWSQKYQKICGAMTVEFNGEEHTLPQMSKYLEETDRSLRENAWERVAMRRLQDREEIDEIFDELIELRDRIARTAGFDHYVDYAFMANQRFDYRPEDCVTFHQAVEHYVVPLARRLTETRREIMGLEALRPWDMAVDPLGRPPLRPFANTDELVEGVKRILRHVDNSLAEQFEGMAQRRELDLDSRKGKAPGGYQYTLEESRRPFIFMNAAGLHRDVMTLLHEAGHAFHCLATREEPLIEYRASPIEFAEVASMAMELFGVGALNEFYSSSEAARAQRRHFEGIIKILPWIAQIDAFQHWLYQNPNHTQEERNGYWLSLDRRFGVPLDWQGYEESRASMWHRQLHLFCHPLYYIEYGIAQIGALQLWTQFQENPADAVGRYQAALALGGSRPLPELFEAAGIRFDFSQETIQPLMQRIEEQLDTLPV